MFSEIIATTLFVDLREGAEVEAELAAEPAQATLHT